MIRAGFKHYFYISIWLKTYLHHNKLNSKKRASTQNGGLKLTHLSCMSP